jgi:hypothetical protein
MIYSRFGTQLTPVSKIKDASGRISIQVMVDGNTDQRNYAVTDLKADDGMPEIDDAIAKLPWRVVESKVQRRENKLR